MKLTDSSQLLPRVEQIIKTEDRLILLLQQYYVVAEDRLQSGLDCGQEYAHAHSGSTADNQRMVVHPIRNARARELKRDVCLDKPVALIAFKDFTRS